MPHRSRFTNNAKFELEAKPHESMPEDIRSLDSDIPDRLSGEASGFPKPEPSDSTYDFSRFLHANFSEA
jgi:hypothetical protein